ncbi:unnamed protein product [Phyllotreta striolata]|uniref:Uncharacterized protein n=1 Tax=Phyllotreta striolata TaxID=444603 RepID=A0A9N9TQQ8_PHYSR|nr:unnamed protein product [Phyllotreta striolata]
MPFVGNDSLCPQKITFYKSDHLNYIYPGRKNDELFEWNRNRRSGLDGFRRGRTGELREDPVAPWVAPEYSTPQLSWPEAGPKGLRQFYTF